MEGKELHKGQVRGFGSPAYSHHASPDNGHIPLFRVKPALPMSFAGPFLFPISCCEAQSSTQSAELMEQTGILNILAHQHAHVHVCGYLAKAPDIHVTTAPSISSGTSAAPADCSCDLVQGGDASLSRPTTRLHCSGTWKVAKLHGRSQERQKRKYL